jgi:hypothetical protein
VLPGYERKRRELQRRRWSKRIELIHDTWYYFVPIAAAVAFVIYKVAEQSGR